MNGKGFVFTFICLCGVLQAQIASDYMVDTENPEVQYLLGICYFNGDGIQKIWHTVEERRMIDKWEKAIKQGDAIAQNDLNRYYKVKAGYWWKKAAEQKHAMAQYNLARSLDNVTPLKIDLGLKNDANTALYWYEEAVKNGLGNSEKELSETAIKQLKQTGYSSSKRNINIMVKPDTKTLLIVIFCIPGFIVFCVLGIILSKRLKI
jgi:TPR repeat protein